MTDDEIAASRAEILNRVPDVMWDRAVPGPQGGLTAYGWIPQPESHRSDFVLVAFLWPDEPLLSVCWSSSVRHSERICAALYGEGALAHHTPCQRIDELLPDVGRTVRS
jgi:hypothetical protein